MNEKEVNNIVKRNFGDVEEIDSLPGGATHHIFSVKLKNGDELVFQGVGSRWHDFPAFETGYRVEPKILQFLDEKDYPAPTPLFWDFSKEESEHRYFALEKIKGENMNTVNEKEQFLELVENAGEKLQELQKLHKFKNPGKIVSDNGEEELQIRSFNWRDMYKSLLLTYTTHMMDRKYDHLRHEIEKVIENNQTELETDEFTIVHQEFGPRNIMVANDTITGIIDWERAISGDPQFDQVLTRERMVQKAEDLDIQDPRRKIEQALENGYGSNLFSAISPEKDDLYRLAYLAQMMWVARDQNPEKYRLEEQFRQIKDRLEK